MPTIEQVLTEVITRLARVERELDDLRSQAGETTSLDVVPTLPNNPYDGQIVLLNDGSGVNQNGSFRRFDEAAGDWNEI